MDVGNMSIEALEHNYWVDTGFDSYVVRTAEAARKKPLSKLSNEEIRLLISQKIGLKYVIPMAIRILEQNPLIEIYFYEGDLLSSVLKLDISDWNNNQSDFRLFQLLIQKNLSLILQCEDISSNLVRKVLEIEL